jgi:5-methylcytosine-specific restriction endonuclease McrA
MRERLDKKKTPEARRFYSSSAWTKTSLEHRKLEPLCQGCRKKGLVVAGVLVHHNPERQDLIEQGLDPFDHKYLETLCFNCHQSELVAKRKYYNN